MAHAPAGVGHVALTVTRLCARTEVSAAPIAPVSCQLPRSGCGKRCSIRLISEPICWETWVSNSFDERIGLVIMASARASETATLSAELVSMLSGDACKPIWMVISERYAVNAPGVLRR